MLLIPADKNLSSQTISRLTARGEPETFSGDDLRYIGMPVGGLFCGTVYLSGDGRLWLWDIFNEMRQGVEPSGGAYQGTVYHPTFGGSYVEPLHADHALRVEQGFRIRVLSESGAIWKTLDANPKTGFSKVNFTGQYPIGTVRYSDDDVQLDVKLEAFSPFIPLDLEDSSLPATIFQFEILNRSNQSLEVTLEGFLENAVLRDHRQLPGMRCVETSNFPGGTLVSLGASRSGLPSDPDFEREGLHDEGSMAIAILGDPAEVREADRKGPLTDRMVGKIGRRLHVAPGETVEINFLLAWFFPNAPQEILGGRKHHYSKRFADAEAVVRYGAAEFERLVSQTRCWRDTWNESTLPYWFLNRTFANTSTLATTTCYRFEDGRFWAWEGVGFCPGTCTHVWHYAHAPARLFPGLERDHREFVDLGLALGADGTIAFRAEDGSLFAVDGQAGRILGVYREHQMSTDDTFLRRIWPKVKLALQRIMAVDPDGSGLLRGPLHNTLDADWLGVVPWLCGMYHAALRAGEEMANEVGDTEFATECRLVLDGASEALDALCWNKDFGYYVHVGDAENPTHVGAYEGCHIDQVLGQSWAWQVGLGQVMTRDKVLTALSSLWRFNFTPDIGPFRAVKTEGRWYALPGEAGMIMVTYPFGGDMTFTGDVDLTARYFNECMSGFEHQVAGHMLWEGMVNEGMALTHAIHDRYCAKRRNPYNEIECGDHYARAMASYGTFLAACGFEYHGPRMHMGFSPRLSPEKFQAAFTAAEGWGGYRQEITPGGISAELEVRWGSVILKSFSIGLPIEIAAPANIAAHLNGDPVGADFTVSGEKLIVTFREPVSIRQNQVLKLTAAL